MTDEDIGELWAAVGRLTGRVARIEAQQAMQRGTVGAMGDSDPVVITPEEPSEPGMKA